MRRWLPGRKRPAHPNDKFGRFTDRARQVIVLAQDEARRLNHSYIDTEHLLLGLTREADGIAAQALTGLGISLQAVRAQIEEIIGRGPPVPAGHVPFTPTAKKVIELSLDEALQLGHSYIGTEHLLLGLLRDGDGVAAQVLVKLGADHAQLREQVLRRLAEGTPTSHRERGLASGLSDLDRYNEQLAKVRWVRCV